MSVTLSHGTFAAGAGGLGCEASPTRPTGSDDEPVGRRARPRPTSSQAMAAAVRGRPFLAWARRS